jgi:GNAT superfamily N-acetyltransferase
VTIPERLNDHLESWLGAWPPFGTGVSIVPHDLRSEPGWDGKVHDLIGVATSDAAMISVAPDKVAAVRALVHGRDLREDLDALAKGLSTALGHAGNFGRGEFRWTDAPADLPDTGIWIAHDEARFGQLPEWLHPFNGEVLVALDDSGSYTGGVGRKLHDEFGHELSVGTDESYRGRGLARNLVATAARRVLADGAIPTYLHDHANVASAHVARAAGFPDRGWEILGFW